MLGILHLLIGVELHRAIRPLLRSIPVFDCRVVIRFGAMKAVSFAEQQSLENLIASGINLLRGPRDRAQKLNSLGRVFQNISS